MRKIYLILMSCILINLMLVSAFQFDNVKEVKDKGGKYPELEIVNAFGLGDSLWKGNLNKNTDTCGNSCSAETTITLGKKGILIEDIKFETILEYGSRIEEPIKNYKLYIRKDNKWVNYNLGEELDAGTYEFKIEGIKELSKTVDWIIKVQGEWLEEWALWQGVTTEGLFAYYDFETGTGTNLVDVVNGNRNGTLINTPTWVDGYMGSGLNFTAADSEYVNFADDFSELQGIAGLSIEAWVKLSSIQGGIVSVIAQAGADPNRIWELGLSDGKPQFTVFRTDTSRAEAISTSAITIGEWYHLAGTYDGSTGISSIYINGILNVTDDQSSLNTETDVTETPKIASVDGGASQFFNGIIDELKIWNVTRNVTEIVSDTFDTKILSPLNDTTFFNTEDILFNLTVQGGGLSNITLYVDGISNETINISGTINTTFFNKSGFTFDNHTWFTEVCDGIRCFNSSLRSFEIVRLKFNSQTYSATGYETDYNNNFTLNISADGLETITANLSFDGTTYPGVKTGDNKEMIFTVVNGTFDLPGDGAENITFNWDIGEGSTVFNSASNNLSVIDTNFSICGGEGGSVPFVNFSFAEESTLAVIPNGTIPLLTLAYFLGSGKVNKSYTFTNNTANAGYAFCGLPVHRNITIDYVLQYEDQEESYPQRIVKNTISLNNHTTNSTLYLLGSSNGIYVTFQVVNQADQPISGVQVTAVRTISGSKVKVGEGETGEDGGTTFWLNPNFEHVITFVASGLTTQTITIFPTQSSYTITMGTTAETPDDPYQGVSSFVVPNSTTLTNDTSYDFEFELTSTYSTVTDFGFFLTNSSGDYLGGDSDTTNGGTTSLNLDVASNNQINMNYYWVINGNYTNGTRTWHVLSSAGTDWSISTFFTDLKNYADDGMFGLDNFGLAIITFLTIFIFTGIMSFKFGLVSPAGISSLVFTLTLFFDVGLGLMDNLGLDLAIPHFPTIFMGIVLAGILFKEVIR